MATTELPKRINDKIRNEVIERVQYFLDDLKSGEFVLNDIIFDYPREYYFGYSSTGVNRAVNPATPPNITVSGFNRLGDFSLTSPSNWSHDD